MYIAIDRQLSSSVRVLWPAPYQVEARIETHNFLTTSVIFNDKIQHVDSPDPFYRRLLLCQYPAQEVQISIPWGAECRKDEFDHSIREFIVTFTELISDVRYFW